MDTKETLLKLVKQSQFEASSDVNFDNVDIEELYKEAYIQSVLGLVVNEIPNEYLNDKWKQASNRQLATYILYNHQEEELKKILDNENIRFVILKGNAAAINYKKPSYRTMGDIDFLVLEDDFKRTIDVLSNNGYTLLSTTSKGLRHASFKKGKTRFELHRKFSHDEINIDDVVLNGFNNIEKGRIDNHEFPMLPRLSNGIVFLDHMKAHLRTALGLRQMIDWMMYVYKNLDDEFWNKEFGCVAKEKGLDILAITATRTCQIYLGLPETITWCKDADEKLCEQLLNCLLESGNFGRKNGRGSSIETVSTSIKREGLFKWLQYAGEHNWKAYQKNHWLKPFCWFYQIFRYAKQGIKAKRNSQQLKDDISRSKARYEVLKKLNID